MARSVVEAGYERVVDATAGKVEPLGYRRDGTVLRKLADGNSAVVQFQRGVDSSADRIAFTINLAVICGALLEPGEPALRRASSTHGHLRVRLGMLLPAAQDLWWEVAAQTDVAELATRISEAVLNVGVPYVQRYLDTHVLLALWKSGESPGLTEKQRLDYIEKLARAGLAS